MSYPTTPAFIFTGDWSADSRKHHVGAWLEQYTNAYDTGLQSLSSQLDKWFTPDFTIVKADGSVHEGLQKAFASLQSTYGPLTEYHHQPTYGVITETSNGWSCVGVADLFYSLPGQGASAGAADNTGKKFDGVIPGAFIFNFVKSDKGPDGLQLNKITLFSDSGPIVVQLLQRGVLKPADIGL